MEWCQGSALCESVEIFLLMHVCLCRKYAIYGSGASTIFLRVYTDMYASIENMGRSAFVLGRGWRVFKLDRRQGSVTNAKTPVRGGGGGGFTVVYKYFFTC